MNRPLVSPTASSGYLFFQYSKLVVVTITRINHVLLFFIITGALSPQSSTDEKKNKSTKSTVKKEPSLGSRPKRSSLPRAKSVPNADPYGRKYSRAESISSDESERTHKAIPPPKDPVPDVNSDFKPYEHWQGLKESQKADVKHKLTAKKEFSEKYHKHGLPKRAPSLVGGSNMMGTPKHHQSSASLAPKHYQSTASLASAAMNDHASKSLLKPEFNPFGANDKYLTPLQQKEKTIRDLQVQVAKLEETIALQGDEIANFNEEKEEALQHLEVEKDAEMDELFQEVKVGVVLCCNLGKK